MDTLLHVIWRVVCVLSRTLWYAVVALICCVLIVSIPYVFAMIVLWFR